MDKYTCPYCGTDALKVVQIGHRYPRYEIQCSGCDATCLMFADRDSAESKFKEIAADRTAVIPGLLPRPLNKPTYLK